MDFKGYPGSGAPPGAKINDIPTRLEDSALYRLVKAGRITIDEAPGNTDSYNCLRLRLSLIEKKEGEEEETDDGVLRV